MSSGLCDYLNLGFVCAGDGFLRLGQQVTKQWPCRKCNTAAFLEKSFRAAKERRKDLSCPCCGPGLSDDEVWSGAMKVANECNPKEAINSLFNLSRQHQPRPGRFKAE
jgi:hypothetical protein